MKETNEIEKLHDALAAFTEAMKERLDEKTENAHWRGWDDSGFAYRFKTKIIQDAERIAAPPDAYNSMLYSYREQDCIDLANYAMFLWNLKRVPR